MLLLLNEDTTSLSYWLNWRVLLCAIWVLTPMSFASYLIWIYEHLEHSDFDRESEEVTIGTSWNRVWSPCMREVPLSFLMAFRIMSFCLLLVAITFDVAVHGLDIFYFYTQWTFMLVTVYFLFGSLLSIYGCYQDFKINSVANALMGPDPESGTYMPLASEKSMKDKLAKSLEYKNKSQSTRIFQIVSHTYEILFQITAGSVMLTDVVYWCVIFPFLTIANYEMSFLTVVAHSLNAVLLVGDALLNSLRLPWYRISYFILWTGIYVIFQWIVHASVPLWWPYPFLDLSKPYAPLWYLVVALMHLPCYGIAVLIVKFKECMFTRWFSQSYIRQR